MKNHYCGHEISLIKLREKHFPLFERWWNDSELRKWTSEISKVKEIMTREEINRILSRHLKNKNDFDFIIVAKKKPVGHILIQKKKGRKHFEIYIAIGEKAYWNKGIGKNAMKRTAYWFFQKFKKEKSLFLQVLIKNVRAISCYEAVGFQKIRLIPKSRTWLMKINRNIVRKQK